VALATRFQISKYPTIKVFINGQPVKKEYRGRRAVDAFVDFIQEQLKDPIQEVENIFVSTDSEDVSQMFENYVRTIIKLFLSHFLVKSTSYNWIL